MGGTHARAFARLPDVKVVAVSSRSLAKAQTLAAEVGAEATTDDAAIIADPRVDAIANTLPTHLHKDFTIAALQAGKPVLLEKPFALNVAECDEILAVRDETGTPLMLGHTLRFWPEYVTLVNYVHSGAIGRPLSAVAARLGTEPNWGSWFADPAQSGGAVLDLMIHDLDVLNWIFGQPKTIDARGQQARPGLWNHVQALVDFGNAVAPDAVGTVEASHFYPKTHPFTMLLRVLCERGCAEMGFVAGSYTDPGAKVTLMAYDAERAFALPIAPEDAGDAYERQIAYFVDYARGRVSLTRGTPEQARLAVACSNAARLSLESGTIVAVG